MDSSSHDTEDSHERLRHAVVAPYFLSKELTALFAEAQIQLAAGSLRLLWRLTTGEVVQVVADASSSEASSVQEARWIEGKLSEMWF